MANVNEKTNTTGTAESKSTFGQIIAEGDAIFLGLHEKAGDFENEKGEKVEYHNFLLNVAFPVEEDNSTVNFYGAECVQYKIKADEICKVFHVPDGVDWYSFFKPDEWLYSAVELSYKRKADRNGNLVLSGIRKV